MKLKKKFFLLLQQYLVFSQLYYLQDKINETVFYVKQLTIIRLFRTRDFRSRGRRASIKRMQLLRAVLGNPLLNGNVSHQSQNIRFDLNRSINRQIRIIQIVHESLPSSYTWYHIVGYLTYEYSFNIRLKSQLF